MLHFQMRIFLLLGVFFVQVKMGKEMRCEGLSQQKGVTVSRRYAAGNCANAQDASREDGR